MIDPAILVYALLLVSIPVVGPALFFVVCCVTLVMA
jgi:hypothetical protein